MSSIIDALKKSDAKRPRKNHGLKIRMDLTNQSKPKRRWGFIVMVALLILILAAVYFQKPDFVWQHLGSVEQTSGVENNPEKSIPTVKQTKKLNKPPPEQVQTAVKNQKNKPPADKHADESKVSEAQKIQPVMVKNEEEPSHTNNAKDINDLKRSQIQKPAQQIDQQLAATPMKNKQAINASPEANKVQEQPDNKLPQLFELPYSIRKNLPKINLSVHVYDPVVENRMAILNGVPIHVGDTFEEKITIQDITPSGVVLRIQDRDFIILK